MGPRTTSVAGLMALVLVVGLGMASLRIATVAWTTIASTLTYLMLMTGVVGAVFSRGTDRAFWAGFALFGWTYLLLVNWGWLGGQFGKDLTGGLLDLAERVHPSNPPAAQPVGPFHREPLLDIEAQQRRYIRVGNFVQIARLLLCLAVALAGGLIASAFAARSRTTGDDGPHPV